MRAIVTGSRFEEDRALVFRHLDAIDRERRIDVVIEGGQRFKRYSEELRRQEYVGGVDYHAKCWAAARSRECITVPADWDTFGRGAGPIRNRIMRDNYAADVVIAFPGGPGSLDMVRRARMASMEIILIERVSA